MVPYRLARQYGASLLGSQILGLGAGNLAREGPSSTNGRANDSNPMTPLNCHGTDRLRPNLLDDGPLEADGWSVVCPEARMAAALLVSGEAPK